MPCLTGMRVYVHSGAATPLHLVEAMTKHGISSKLNNVEVVQMATEGVAEYAQPHCKGACSFLLAATVVSNGEL